MKKVENPTEVAYTFPICWLLECTTKLGGRGSPQGAGTGVYVGVSPGYGYYGNYGYYEPLCSEVYVGDSFGYSYYGNYGYYGNYNNYEPICSEVYAGDSSRLR